MNTQKYKTKNYKGLASALAFTLAFVLYLSLVLVPVSSCFRLEFGSNSLGLSFSYTEDMVMSFFEARTQAQLLCYSKFLQMWDVLFAIVSTMMFGSWIMYLFKDKRLFLIAPTTLGMVADWSENYIELLMIETYLSSNTISETLVSLGSGLNSFKLTMGGLTYLIIITGIFLALKRLLTRRKAN